MGINVAHGTSPGFAALTGYAAGKSRRQDIEQERLIRAMELQGQRKMQRRQMDEAARQFNARLDQSNNQFDQEMDYRWEQSDLNRRTQFGLADLAHQNRLTEMGYQNQYRHDYAGPLIMFHLENYELEFGTVKLNQVNSVTVNNRVNQLTHPIASTWSVQQDTRDMPCSGTQTGYFIRHETFDGIRVLMGGSITFHLIPEGYSL